VTGIGYRYESAFVHAFGPWHPNQAKSALVCVTANGMVKLFWSQNNNKVEETISELESINASDDSITHASICNDKSASPISILTIRSLTSLFSLCHSCTGDGVKTAASTQG
jgi:mediator of RNA polymerase II transcription subunit 16, fungi type